MIRKKRIDCRQVDSKPTSIERGRPASPYSGYSISRIELDDRAEKSPWPRDDIFMPIRRVLIRNKAMIDYRTKTADTYKRT